VLEQVILDQEIRTFLSQRIDFGLTRKSWQWLPEQINYC